MHDVYVMLRYIAPPGVSIAILLILVSQVNFATLRSAVGQAHVLSALVVVACLAIGHTFAVLRWKSLLVSAYPNVSLRELWNVYMGNIPIARWVPMYGGDALRVYYMRKTIDTKKGTAVIATEAFIDLGVLIVLGIMGSLFLSYWKQALFFGCMLLALYAVRKGLTHQATLRVLNIKVLQGVLQGAHFSRAALMRAIGYTFCMWASVLLSIFFCFRAYDIDMTLVSILLAQPVVILVSLLPVSFGGLGTREAAMMYMYQGAAAQESLFLSAFMFSVVSLVILPIIALPFAIRLWRKELSNFR